MRHVSEKRCLFLNFSDLSFQRLLPIQNLLIRSSMVLRNINHILYIYLQTNSELGRPVVKTGERPFAAAATRESWRPLSSYSLLYLLYQLAH